MYDNTQQNATNVSTKQNIVPIMRSVCLTAISSLQTSEDLIENLINKTKTKVKKNSSNL